MGDDASLCYQLSNPASSKERKDPKSLKNKVASLAGVSGSREQAVDENVSSSPVDKNSPILDSSLGMSSQDRRDAHTAWKEKAGVASAPPPLGRRGHVPTSSEGRANAQVADSSRSGLLKLEFDISEDAANKAPRPPHPTPSPRKLGKGPSLKPPSRRPRQEKAPEQAEEGPFPPLLLTSLAEPEAGRLGAGPLTTTHLGGARCLPPPLDGSPP
ncbi:unnamed protein product, partial [Rangifer tarandus platyrhynchus]